MEQLREILAFPIIQVLLGAVISAIVALTTTHLNLRHQRTSLEVAHLTRLSDQISDIIKEFDPITFTVDDDCNVGQTITLTKNYEIIRRLFFKNIGLLPISIRNEMLAAFRRAELAYFYLHAPGEKNKNLRAFASQHLHELDVATIDIQNLSPEALKVCITDFCSSYREVLILLHDSFLAEIHSSFGKRWMSDE